MTRERMKQAECVKRKGEETGRRGDREKSRGREEEVKEDC